MITKPSTTKWAYTDSSTLTCTITRHIMRGGGGVILPRKAANLVFVFSWEHAVFCPWCRERYRKPNWKTKVPDSHKLKDEDITQFVEIMKPEVFTAMFGKWTSQDAAIRNLTALRAEIIMPPLLEKWVLCAREIYIGRLFEWREEFTAVFGKWFHQGAAIRCKQDVRDGFIMPSLLRLAVSTVCFWGMCRWFRSHYGHTCKVLMLWCPSWL